MGHRVIIWITPSTAQSNKLCVGAFGAHWQVYPYEPDPENAACRGGEGPEQGPQTSIIYSNYGAGLFLRHGARRHWVDQVVDLPFENMKLMAPAGWHQILAWL